MKLQTTVLIKKENRNTISYKSKVLLLGSCFSENMANKLSYYKFQAEQNPFGILFHPKAIENLITNSINKKIYTEKDIIFNNERWHCFDAHSSLSATSKNELLHRLNSVISFTQKQLTEATYIIITLGSSWVYKFMETNAIVANCHKIPQKKFLKKLLTVDEISESLEKIIELIKTVNKEVNILFTVSPIRHLKDGFIENMRSKSHLISAIHNVIAVKKNTHYFPSYEIMMDELRDYRFYTEDMIHPNKTAINYIWGKFVSTWFAENTKATMQEVEIIQKGINHKPFNKNSKEHENFLKNLHEKIVKIQQEIPSIKFNNLHL